MRHIVLAAAIIGSIATAGAPAAAQVDTTRTIISVSATARQNVSPDRATIVFLIEPTAMSVDEAVRSTAAVERAVMDTLRKLVGASSIASFSGGVGPYRNNMGSMQGGPTFSGRSVLRVEVQHLEQLAAISAAVLSKGVTYIGPPMFSFSGADSLRHALIGEAFQSAQRDAEALARAAGGRVGKLIDVSVPQAGFNYADQNPFINNPQYDSGQRPIPSVAVTVTVTTRWVLIH